MHTDRTRTQPDSSHPSTVSRVVRRSAHTLPPLWLAHAELDDNMPAKITDARVRAYEQRGGTIERVFFPSARHGFISRAN